MTLPDNFSAILTDLQKLQCWPKTHGLTTEPVTGSWDGERFTEQTQALRLLWNRGGTYTTVCNCLLTEPMAEFWLTSLAMHLLGHLENRFYLSESIIDIESDGLCIHLQKHTNNPQSIALAIIQAAHAVLVEKK